MKKLFKIALFSLINLIGVFLIVALIFAFIDRGSSILNFGNLTEDVLILLSIFPLYLYNAIFQVKTLPLYIGQVYNNKPQLLDTDIEVQQLTQAKKIKLHPILWAACFISGLSISCLGGIILIEILLLPNISTPIWFHSLVTFGILFLGISIWYDMAMVYKMNKNREAA